jgi:hypothetical protein
MNWTMETVYLGCAAAGGTVLILQTVMLLFGGGGHDGDVVSHDGDVGHDGHVDGDHHDGHGTLTLLSVRTGAAFLAFFGLAGWGALRAGWNPLSAIGAALAAGTASLFAVAWLFSLQRKLQAQGNLDPRNALDKAARVYLRIPAGNAGKGKITVAIQGRTAEYDASTLGAELPTGSEVRIVRQLTPDTFEVEALDRSSR